MVRLTKDRLNYIRKRLDLAKHDWQILRFVAKHRIATSGQIKRVFFPHATQRACNKRLKILEDLGCLDVFYPEVPTGSSPKHLVIGPAGIKLLGLSRKRARHLPKNYKHTVAVTELYVQCRDLVERWEPEFTVDNMRLDALATVKGQDLIIEVDLGTETLATLKAKAKGLKALGFVDLPPVIFLTKGSRNRMEKMEKFMAGLQCITGMLSDGRRIINKWVQKHNPRQF